VSSIREQRAGASVTKQERVYLTIRERILAGEYAPGYRLVIDQLAATLDVSALPVREAIRRLEAEGLVVFRPNAGAHVAPADPDLFDEEMTVLAVLEGYATALAAPRLTRADIDRLAELTDRMEDALGRGDSLGFGRLNQEYHAVVHERCPNVALVELIRDVALRLDSIRRTVFVQIPYRGSESLAEHRRLTKLIARNASASTIEDAAREHKLATVESFRAWRAEQQG
jgi:DNA-binding GntR family transcriptional regulator